MGAGSLFVETFFRADLVAKSLPEIGKATHYHATYVSPWWVRTMTKHKTLGIHIFYRPTRWGDGSEAPAWGPAASVEQSVAKARM